MVSSVNSKQYLPFKDVSKVTELANGWAETQTQTTNSKPFGPPGSHSLLGFAAGCSRILTRSQPTEVGANPVPSPPLLESNSSREDDSVGPALLLDCSEWSPFIARHPRSSQAQLPAALLQYLPRSTPFLLHRRHPAFPPQGLVLPRAFLQGLRPPGPPSATCPSRY